MGKRNVLNEKVSKEVRDSINDEINTYAANNGYSDGVEMQRAISEGLSSLSDATRSSTEAIVSKTINELSPRIFIQLVENFGGYSLLTKQMSPDFWGVYDEGQGFEMFSGLQNAPLSTKILDTSVAFIPSEYTEQYSYNWSLKYVDQDAVTMTDQAYAFRQNLVIQKTRLLTQFRTGSGFQFLTMMLINYYDSLVFTQYAFWAQNKLAKYTQLVNNNEPNTNINGRELVVNGNGRDAFNAWLEIFETIYKMCNINSNYNFNASFKRISSVNIEDIVLYVSNKTYTTLNHCIQSQLFNNTKFVDILNKIKIVVPSYKLKWRNNTSSQITINGTTVNANDKIDPIMKLATIPSGFVWDASDEEYIPDNKVVISTKDSFIWIRQTKMEMSQEFANNFTSLKSMYELGAMDFRPDAKFAIYKNDNINVNPSSTTTIEE